MAACASELLFFPKVLQAFVFSLWGRERAFFNRLLQLLLSFLEILYTYMYICNEYIRIYFFGSEDVRDMYKDVRHMTVCVTTWLVGFPVISLPARR